MHSNLDNPNFTTDDNCVKEEYYVSSEDKQAFQLLSSWPELVVDQWEKNFKTSVVFEEDLTPGEAGQDSIIFTGPKRFMGECKTVLEMILKMLRSEPRVVISTTLASLLKFEVLKNEVGEDIRCKLVEEGPSFRISFTLRNKRRAPFDSLENTEKRKLYDAALKVIKHIKKLSKEKRKVLNELDSSTLGIFVAGVTGAGKSSLINHFLGATLMKIGNVIPITTVAEIKNQDVENFRHPTLPIYLFDSVGLENDAGKKSGGWKKYKKQVAETCDFIIENGKVVNFLWFCIDLKFDRCGKTIPNVDEVVNIVRDKFPKLRDENIIFILTKCDIANIRKVNLTKELVREKFPDNAVFVFSTLEVVRNLRFSRFCPSANCYKLEDPREVDDFKFRCVRDMDVLDELSKRGVTSGCGREFYGCEVCKTEADLDFRRHKCRTCGKNFEPNVHPVEEKELNRHMLTQFNKEELEVSKRFRELQCKLVKLDNRIMDDSDESVSETERNKLIDQRLQVHKEVCELQMYLVHLRNQKYLFLQSRKKSFNIRIGLSIAEIIAATSLSAVVGLSPIPFSDAPFLIAIEIALGASLCATWCISKDAWEFIRGAGLSTLIGSGLFALVAGTGWGIANALKLIPVFGTIPGMAIDFAVAGAFTCAYGIAITVVLVVYDRLEGSIKGKKLAKKTFGALDLKKIAQLGKKLWRGRRGDTSGFEEDLEKMIDKVQKNVEKQ